MRILALLLILSTQLLVAETVALTFPDEVNSLLTPRRDIQTLTVRDGKLVFIPASENIIFVSKYLPSETVRDKRFDTLMTMQRVPIVEHHSKAFFSGIERVPGGWLVLDGKGLELYFYNDQFTLISKRSLIYDLLKPPADSGGEAPYWEVQELRKRFLRNIKKAPGTILMGMVMLKSDEKGFEMLSATRIPEFPIVKLKCEANLPNQCELTRACYTAGKFPEPADINGFAYNDKTNLILLTDSRHRNIQTFHYQSCLHIEKQSTVYTIPERIRTPAGLHLSAEGQLWLATLQPDDYLNASIYRWDAP